MTFAFSQCIDFCRPPALPLVVGNEVVKNGKTLVPLYIPCLLKVFFLGGGRREWRSLK
jgi:hypothetical protein